MTETGFNPTQLTWTALLGRWMDFARASLALPDDAEGVRWRESIVPIITLQAVTFALSNLDQLPEHERALGLDRAEILVRDHVGRLNEIWRSEPMPPLLLELVHDARQSFKLAQLGLVVEVVLPNGPGSSYSAESPFVVPDVTAPLQALADAGFDGGIALALPGTLLVSEEPVGYVLRRPQVLSNGEPDEDDTERQATILAALDELFAALRPAAPTAVQCPRQVYRLIDDNGRITGDLVAPMSDDPRPGRPLLLPALLDGQVQRFPVAGESWEDQQRTAWPDRKADFSVEFQGS